MIIPDINLLIYSYDASSPFHPKAAAWWADCLSGAEPIGLAPVVLFGFVRISTLSRVFLQPLSTAEAAELVRSWLDRPVAQILEPPADHVPQVLRLLEGIGTAGNLVTDAQLAALAIAHDAVLHTADADFLRFPGLRWVNPLTAKSGTGSKPPKPPARSRHS
jgi:toxin-antitoxin system PIN domain toxin